MEVAPHNFYAILVVNNEKFNKLIGIKFACKIQEIFIVFPIDQLGTSGRPVDRSGNVVYHN